MLERDDPREPDAANIAGSQVHLPAEIRRLLQAVRWRIRGYVWLQGLALAALWAVLTFWCALALDYLPVLAGAAEMPRAARIALLTLVAAGLFWILYRWILRRAFAPLADRSMALLLERQHRGFGDSLITSVELAERGEIPSSLNAMLLKETQREAMRHVDLVRAARVFNLRPLTLSLLAAAAMLVSLAGFYAVNARALGTGVRRLYLLRDEPWPRQAYIEVVGVESLRSVGGQESATLLAFRRGTVRVAKGSSIRLVVHAEANQHKVPDTCTIAYRTADGDRGRVNMTRVGRVRQGHQVYHYDGKPLRDVLTRLDFDVVGFDYRTAVYQIDVVDRPAVIDCQLDCVFPKYMVDESLGLWQPRTVPLTTGTQLPQGTQIVLRAESSKPLREVRVTGTGSAPIAKAELSGPAGRACKFSIRFPKLTENLGLDLVLLDTDGIQSERPYRVFIGAKPDVPPVVEATMAGISAAVTPDVAIPFRGSIRDDYGLRRSWIETVRNASAPQQHEVKIGSGGELHNSLDFRDLRTREPSAALTPKDKLTLVVKAQDKYDLGKSPNVGAGDHYALDVVTPDELLALLEAREIGLRQRFEQIIEETKETRDMLVRVKAEGPTSVAPGSEAGESSNAETAAKAPNPPEAARKRVWSVRLLRAQQALLQSQKSAQETLGTAAGFRDIREELINNRIDTKDRKERLQTQLADPLERIGKELFPELDQRLRKITDRLDRQLDALAERAQEDPETIAAADAAIQQADRILVAMTEVLQNMLNLETYNELLDIVRSLIEDQRSLIDQTKQQQKKQVLDRAKALE